MILLSVWQYILSSTMESAISGFNEVKNEMNYSGVSKAKEHISISPNSIDLHSF